MCFFVKGGLTDILLGSILKKNKQSFMKMYVSPMYVHWTYDCFLSKHGKRMGYYRMFGTLPWVLPHALFTI